VSLTPVGEKLLADSLPRWRAAQERFVQAMGRNIGSTYGRIGKASQVAVQLESEAPGTKAGIEAG